VAGPDSGTASGGLTERGESEGRHH
jgi:hypothetical protein